MTTKTNTQTETYNVGMNPLFDLTYEFPVVPTKEQLVDFIASFNNVKEPAFSTESVGYALDADDVTDKRFRFDDIAVLNNKPYSLLSNVAKYIVLSRMAEQIELGG